MVSQVSLSRILGTRVHTGQTRLRETRQRIECKRRMLQASAQILRAHAEGSNTTSCDYAHSPHQLLQPLVPFTAATGDAPPDAAHTPQQATPRTPKKTTSKNKTKRRQEGEHTAETLARRVLEATLRVGHVQLIRGQPGAGVATGGPSNERQSLVVADMEIAGGGPSGGAHVLHLFASPSNTTHGECVGVDLSHLEARADAMEATSYRAVLPVATPQNAAGAAFEGHLWAVVGPMGQRQGCPQESEGMEGTEQEQEQEQEQGASHTLHVRRVVLQAVDASSTEAGNDPEKDPRPLILPFSHDVMVVRTKASRLLGDLSPLLPPRVVQSLLAPFAPFSACARVCSENASFALVRVGAISPAALDMVLDSLHSLLPQYILFFAAPAQIVILSLVLMGVLCVPW
eukprot:TRINITY_DN4020_c0_g1_i2.p1 TRINITY_DN4020_c0_g1~~TRINITY_DN4020_c0_g1_i2.p1  ORF type:complete len:401 (+),score=68.42 TRINITY_DN4020_c0_g1_i2:950-2152(+)